MTYHHGHCGYCCYGSNLGYENPFYRDVVVHYHPDCPLHGHLAMDLPGTGG